MSRHSIAESSTHIDSLHMEEHHGAFKERKSTLSLDLNKKRNTTITTTTTTTDHIPLLHFGADSSNALAELAKKSEYVRGFNDALQTLQTSNNFKFDTSASALLSPSYVMPVVVNQVSELLNSPMLTPVNTRDILSIVQAMTALTPTSQMPSTTTSDIFSSVFPSVSSSAPFPGPSTVSSSTLPSPINPSTSSMQHQQQHQQQQPIMEVKQENLMINSDDSSDSMSERSTSASLSNGQRNKFHELTMDEQERRKLERKRARNRLAASKCRQKKMDRISELEILVSEEKARASQLDNEMMRLHNALNQVRALISNHQQRGCPPLHP